MGKLGAAEANGPEGDVLDWDAVQWRRAEDDVRRLRQRIFTASRAGDLKKVRSLNDQEESVKLAIEEACHVGRRHGVGVIVMGDPCDFAKWEEKEEARRVVPDPQRLDEFIAVQLSQTAHDQIARALH